MRRQKLIEDQRAAVYFEFLVVFMPVFILFLGMTQVALLMGARLVVQHSATQAARSAAVVLPDDPAFHGETRRDQADFREVALGTDEGIAGRALNTLKGLARLLYGVAIPDNITATGDPRLNAVRLAAYKPLIPLSPTLRGTLNSDQTVGDAVGDANQRVLSALQFLTYGAAVTFPSRPGGHAATSGAQSFTYRRGDRNEITTRVTFLMHCAVPFARDLICNELGRAYRQSSSGYSELSASLIPILHVPVSLFGDAKFYILRAESTMLYQGAAYCYRSEC